MYSDDLVLMAPTWDAMQAMLAVCERYGAENNISYSTDPDPKKSKTKSVYMCGNVQVANIPRPCNSTDWICLSFRALRTLATNSRRPATWNLTAKSNVPTTLTKPSTLEKCFLLLNLSKFSKQWGNIAVIIMEPCYGHWTVTWRASTTAAGRRV